MRYGIRTDYCRDWDLDTLLAHAAEIGFDGIQICTGGNEPGQMAGAIETCHAEAAKRRLSVGSISLDYLCSGGSPIAEEPEKREAGFQVFRETAEACGRLGIGVILFPFFGKYMVATDKHVARLTAEIGRYAETCERCGVEAALESSMNAAQLRRVMAAGTARIGVYLDPSNVHQFCGNLLAETEAVKDRVFEIHAKDKVYGAQSKHMERLGEGETDLRGAYGIMKRAGYDRWIVLETAAGKTPEANVTASLAYVKSLWRDL